MKYVMWFSAATYLALLVAALVLRLLVRIQRRSEGVMVVAFDRVGEAFESIVECEAALDDVIEKLAGIGVVVSPEQRGVVWGWLEDVDAPGVPLDVRLDDLFGRLR